MPGPMHWNRRTLIGSAGAAGALALLDASRLVAASGLADLMAEGGAGGSAAQFTSAQIAWLASTRTTTPVKGADASILLGIAPNATIVGEIAPFNGLSRRPPSGDHFVIARSEPNAAKTASTLFIDLCSATDGSLLRSFTGRTIALNGPNAQGVDEQDSSAIVPSPDGRVLAIRRWVMRIDPARVVPGKGGTAPATSYTISVEMLDLVTGRFSRPLELDRGDGSPVFGDLHFAPDNRTLYYFGQSYTDQSAGITAYVAVLDFDGQSLRERQRVRSGDAGRVIPDQLHHNLSYSQPVFQDDGQTLLSFGSQMLWFDLAAFTVAATLRVEVQQTAKPVEPTTLIAPDQQRLYVVNCRFGAIHPIDLIQRTVLPPVTIPEGPRLPWPYGPGIWPVLGSSQRAALSPDGQYLYMIDNRTNTSIAVVRLPDLTLVDRWLLDWLPTRLRLSADGQTLYVLVYGDELLCVNCADGTIRGSINLAPGAGYFV